MHDSDNDANKDSRLAPKAAICSGNNARASVASDTVLFLSTKEMTGLTLPAIIAGL